MPVDGPRLAGSAAAVRPGSVGTTATRKPSRAASAMPLRQVADPAQLAGQADLAHRDDALRAAAARGGRGERDRDREVAGRLEQPGAADGGGEHVVGVQPDAAVLLEHREHHRDPRAVEPRGRAPGPLGGGGRDQRLHLGQQRPAALHGHRDAGAGRPGRGGSPRTARSGR